LTPASIVKKIHWGPLGEVLSFPTGAAKKICIEWCSVSNPERVVYVPLPDDLDISDFHASIPRTRDDALLLHYRVVP